MSGNRGQQNLDLGAKGADAPPLPVSESHNEELLLIRDKVNKLVECAETIAEKYSHEGLDCVPESANRGGIYGDRVSEINSALNRIDNILSGVWGRL